MEMNISSGITLTMERVVEPEDTAEHYGSGLLPVYATPAMIGFMEEVAQTLLQPHLPEGYITLGIAINVRHTKATPVGTKVFCTAVLEEVDRKRFHFSVTARDEYGDIGQATHTRAMVEAKTFMEGLQ